MTCKHCGRRFLAGGDQSEFCCSGCEQVYHLLQEKGLSGFYDWQDRSGPPLPPAAQGNEETESLKRFQERAEETGSRPEAQLRVVGMRCMGCIWLVERLSRGSSGVRAVEASLESGSLYLSWEAGRFDLAALAEELSRFGYRLKPVGKGGLRGLSPLDWRVLLCALFTMNAALLALPQWLEAGHGEYKDLFALLSVGVAVLTIAVGWTGFAVPAWHALRAGEPHPDIFAAMGLGIVFLSIPAALPSGGHAVSGKTAVFAGLVFLALFARWLQEMLFIRRTNGASLALEDRMAARKKMSGRSMTYLATNFSVVLLAAVVLAASGVALDAWLDRVSALLLAGAFFPFARAAEAGDVSRGWWVFGAAIAWLGMALGWAGGWHPAAAVLWAGAGGLLWLHLLTVFKRSD
ncbi:MAG: heavy metal translocating P-type ATPase metal-binding domain-containing protein [Opitutales bacterium]